MDDKLKDSDFYLEDEEIILEDEELPELPTDFNVFSSASTNENPSYSHPPPFSNFAPPSSPPPDEQLTQQQTHRDKSESPQSCDVAKEKESFKIDDAVSQQELAQSAGDDNRTEASSSACHDAPAKNVPASSVKDDDEEHKQTLISTSVLKEDDENIPCKDVPLDDDVHINKKDLEKDETVLNQDVNDDDNCNKFVEANAKELKAEFPGAFKTEESFEDLPDDIPEPIPELNLDEDDDDDFNDFETAIPINRQVEQGQTFFAVKSEPKATEQIPFEADFSGFNAFSESTVENSFDDTQIFKTDVKKQEFQSEADEDDDFGDFSDFTQAPAPVVILADPPFTFIKPANVSGIIDMMFPPTSRFQEQPEIQQDGDYVKEQHIIKKDIFVNKFNDFDSTLALGYLYSNSKTSQSLVTALGIDTRNIVMNSSFLCFRGKIT